MKQNPITVLYSTSNLQEVENTKQEVIKMQSVHFRPSKIHRTNYISDLPVYCQGEIIGDGTYCILKINGIINQF